MNIIDSAVVEALAELARFYPNAAVGADTFRAYAGRLSRFESRVVKAAILQLCDTHRYATFPALGDIIGKIQELCPDGYPSPDEAWGIVRKMARRQDVSEHSGRTLIRQALEDVTTMEALRDADFRGLERHRTRFIQRYTELLAEQRLENQMAPDVSSLLAGIEQPYRLSAEPKKIGGGR